MNLHGIVSPVIAVVNPMTKVVVRFSTGFATDSAGRRTPTYEDVPMIAQVQALSYKDLVQIEGLNINGTRRAIYLSGDVDGVSRLQRSGGDLVVFPNDSNVPPHLLGTVWLVAQALETWPDWCKIAATLQNEKSDL